MCRRWPATQLSQQSMCWGGSITGSCCGGTFLFSIPPRAMLTPLLPCLPSCAAGSEGEAPLLGEDGQRVLHGCMELDYMTHIVLRMFENTT